MVTSHTWGDTALCHALGCAFEVDVLILMGGHEVLVGVSLMDDSDADVELLACISMLWHHPFNVFYFPAGIAPG